MLIAQEIIQGQVGLDYVGGDRLARRDQAGQSFLQFNPFCLQGAGDLSPLSVGFLLLVLRPGQLGFHVFDLDHCLEKQIFERLQVPGQGFGLPLQLLELFRLADRAAVQPPVVLFDLGPKRIHLKLGLPGGPAGVGSSRRGEVQRLGGPPRRLIGLELLPDILQAGRDPIGLQVQLLEAEEASRSTHTEIIEARSRGGQCAISGTAPARIQFHT